MASAKGIPQRKALAMGKTPCMLKKGGSVPAATIRKAEKAEKTQGEGAEKAIYAKAGVKGLKKGGKC